MRHVVRLALARALASACALLLASAAPAKTVWLCQPGLTDNPCTPGPATTPLTPDGRPQGQIPQPAASPARSKVDCFYVYPTVSDQKTPEANLTVDPEERSIALYQAARYSSVCRIFAPMYRQITLAGLLNPNTVTTKMRQRAYGDVRAAWRDYLEHHNKGHGVVFISHSQGTFMLRRLLAREVDPKPSVRKRVISALLLGGNVLVRRGSGVGGDFRHLPACRSTKQLHCVVAFSTYNATPPANSVFGRVAASNPLLKVKTTKDARVLCVNPAALRGGSGTLETIEPTAPFAPGTTIGALTAQIGFTIPAGVTTPWVSTRAYTASCSSAGGANVLLIRGLPGAPQLNALPDATWGLHLADANIALGNLVKLVATQAGAYTRRR